MMNLILFIMFVGALAALIGLYGAYQVKAIKLRSAEAQIDRLGRALDTSRGYLLNVSTYDLPSISDSAVRTLDELDRLTKETK